jgi:hypothetical protein
MFTDVHFTGTINLGQVATSIVTLIGVLVAYYRLKIEFMRGQQSTQTTVKDENQKTRDCIHQLPGHPENPNTTQNSQ